MNSFLENMVSNNPGFSKYLDEALRTDRIIVSRIVAISTLVMYALFVVVDWYSVQENLAIIILIRFIVVVYLFLTLIATYHKEFFLRHYGFIATGFALFSGGGIEVMLLFVTEADLAFYTYFAGLTVIIMGSFTWTYLNTTVSLIISLFFILFYIGIFYFSNQGMNNFRLSVLINHVAFLSIAVVVGLLGDILLKHYLYRQYMLQSRLRELLLANNVASYVNGKANVLNHLPNLHQYKILLNKQILDAKYSNLLLSINCLQLLDEEGLIPPNNRRTTLSTYEIIIDRLNEILPSSTIFALLENDRVYFSFLLERQSGVEIEKKTSLILSLVYQIIKDNHGSTEVHPCIGSAKYFQNTADTDSLIKACDKSLLDHINKQKKIVQTSKNMNDKKGQVIREIF